MTTTITREQAVCLLFCKEYNEDNIKMILEKVAPKSMETRKVINVEHLILIKLLTVSYRPIDIYISTSENICLVAIDFAGLSTNTSDLYDFIL